GREGDPGEIEPAEPVGPEHAEHGGDDGGEHHLHHSEVPSCELVGDGAGTPQAGALERGAEGEADGHRGERGRTVEEGGDHRGAVSRRWRKATRKALPNATGMKSHAPGASRAAPARPAPP